MATLKRRKASKGSKSSVPQESQCSSEKRGCSDSVFQEVQKQTHKWVEDRRQEQTRQHTQEQSDELTGRQMHAGNTGNKIHQKEISSESPAAYLKSPSRSDNHRRIYEAYANSYPSRFRAAIDYQFTEEPRQIWGLFVLLIGCILAGLHADKRLEPLVRTTEPGLSQMPDAAIIRSGFCGVAFCFFVYCFLQTRDGLLVRPHPGFWRLVHAAGLVHIAVFALLAALPVSAGRQFVRLFFPNLVPIDLASGSVAFQGTLDLQCTLSWRTLGIQMRKMWFISHLIGWFAKMCIFRNWLFCFILSLAFEATELSFQWMIPELKECWWDSLLLDVLVSNTAGMLVGVAALKVFNVVCYNWMDIYCPLKENVVLADGSEDATEHGADFPRVPGAAQINQAPAASNDRTTGGVKANDTQVNLGGDLIDVFEGASRLNYKDAAALRSSFWKSACNCASCSSVDPRQHRPLARIVMRFMPFTWTEFRWSFFRSPERLMQAAVLLVLALLTELNAFMIMYALDIPATHPFHVFRVTELCFLALSGVAEIHHYVNTPASKQRRIGHNSWLFLAVIGVELVVLIRYGRTRFLRMIPDWGVLLPWNLTAFCLIIWCILHFTVVGPQRLKVPRHVWRAILKRHGDSIAPAVEAPLKHIAESLHAEFPSSSIDDITIILEEMDVAKKRWGSTVYAYAARIVSLPPAVCFVPLFGLMRYYDFD